MLHIAVKTNDLKSLLFCKSSNYCLLHQFFLLIFFLLSSVVLFHLYISFNKVVNDTVGNLFSLTDALQCFKSLLCLSFYVFSTAVHSLNMDWIFDQAAIIIFISSKVHYFTCLILEQLQLNQWPLIVLY